MANHTNFSRRLFLKATAAGLATPAIGTMAQAMALPELSIFGPPAGPSITLAHAVASGKLAEVSAAPSFTAWRSPDELRAGLTSGSIQISVVPVQAAANLYNRGFPIRLTNVMTNGLLYVISEDAAIKGIADLKGRHIAVPFRGDTPEILLAQLLEHHNLAAETDLKITYTGTPTEAMQMMMAGRVDAALTSEPAATAAILKGKKMAGKTIHRVIDLQEAWGEMTGAAPVLPQAGLAVTQSFLDSSAQALPAIQAALDLSVAEVQSDPMSVAKNATDALGLPAPVLAKSVPSSNLVVRASHEARADIERMLSAMSGAEMKKIGGKLPDDAFYI
ncbi:ABC transporter substrate-binding protein [Shimia sp.]|uniref:ABC transporter substrate-binding protein n=1 Tax=unclassified Shimia TaxID=2630038 RepID=UPI0025CFFEB9|nr:MqnA/MqnD/SBP family protein [Shimia sp.]MCH2069337.1 PhnD/SsuA/transferrin family substrate-binding protein [Shimia sp.]